MRANEDEYGGRHCANFARINPDCLRLRDYAEMRTGIVAKGQDGAILVFYSRANNRSGGSHVQRFDPHMLAGGARHTLYQTNKSRAPAAAQTTPA